METRQARGPEDLKHMGKSLMAPGQRRLSERGTCLDQPACSYRAATGPGTGLWQACVRSRCQPPGWVSSLCASPAFSSITRRTLNLPTALLWGCNAITNVEQSQLLARNFSVTVVTVGIIIRKSLGLSPWRQHSKKRGHPQSPHLFAGFL